MKLSVEKQLELLNLGREEDELSPIDLNYQESKARDRFIRYNKRLNEFFWNEQMKQIINED